MTIQTITKDQASLGNVDNTSDAAKTAAFVAAPHTYTAAQRGAFTALTSASASIAVDLDLSNNYNHTLTENTTLAAPSNAVAGQSGVIRFTQHASAAKTLAFASFWKFAGGTDPTVSTGASAVDVLSYMVAPDGLSADCSWLGGMA